MLCAPLKTADNPLPQPQRAPKYTSNLSPLKLLLRHSQRRYLVVTPTPTPSEPTKSTNKIDQQNQPSKSTIKINHQNQPSKSTIKIEYRNQPSTQIHSRNPTNPKKKTDATGPPPPSFATQSKQTRPSQTKPAPNVDHLYLAPSNPSLQLYPIPATKPLLSHLTNFSLISHPYPSPYPPKPYRPSPFPRPPSSPPTSPS